MPDDGSLLPDVSRFKKPTVVDDAGKNRFSEDEPEGAASPSDAEIENNPFYASTQQTLAPSYQPQYEVTLKHRGNLLLVLSILSTAAISGGLAGLYGLYPQLFVMFIFAFPLNLISSFMAFQDLRAIRFGAMDPAGRTITRIAFILTIANNLIYFLFFVVLLVMAKMGYDLLEQWFG